MSTVEVSSAAGRGLGRRSRPAAAVAAVVMVLSLLGVGVRPAAGQNQFQATWGIYRPTVTADDLKSMSRLFILDEMQTQLAQSLYDGFQVAFEEGASAAKAARDAIREQGMANGRQNPQIWAELGPQMQAIDQQWAEKSTGLETTFFEDVKAVLTDEQSAKWSQYERDRRRRMTLNVGARLSSEGVDLVAIVDGLDVPEDSRAEVQGTLDAYSEELDRALVDRNNTINETNEAFKRMAETRRQEEAQALLKQSHEKRVVLRDVNVRYAAAIEGQLPGEFAGQFHRIFLEESFPQIFRPTTCQRYIGFVLTLESLTDDQRLAIEAVKTRYESQLEVINMRLVDLERQFEIDSQMVFGGRAGPMGGPAAGATKPRENDPRVALWKERGELDNRTIQEVFDLLTADQQALAPKGSMGPGGAGTKGVASDGDGGDTR